MDHAFGGLEQALLVCRLSKSVSDQSSLTKCSHHDHLHLMTTSISKSIFKIKRNQVYCTDVCESYTRSFPKSSRYLSSWSPAPCTYNGLIWTFVLPSTYRAGLVINDKVVSACGLSQCLPRHH